MVTHPYHPLHGRQFELVIQRQNWGEDRVFYYDDQGELTSLPRAWTSRRAVDPFVELSAGRCPFRLEDLLALAQHLKRRVEAGEPARHV